MAKLQPARGTKDMYGEDARRHLEVIKRARALAERYGFEPVETPIFEFSEVFQKTLGEASDVVLKEMYTFTDKGGETVTLRPENTAGICRAYMTNGWQQIAPVKVFAAGPMFRYERPQKGRYRQFHQIDAEIIGVAGPLADIEVIQLAHHVLVELGIWDKTVLNLNTLGDTESRNAYREALVAYFSDNLSRLSEDSKDRLGRNPLRILDSKDEGDRVVVADAPLFGDYLNQASEDFFGAVKDGLTASGIPFEINPRLVRGLDYYSHTAFEFITDALGTQGTVIGGGRYDGLMKMMGGADTPAVGWAGGIERLSMLINAPDGAPRPIAVIPVGEAEAEAAFVLAHRLRHDGYAVDLGYSGNMGKRMKRANKVNARAAVLIGSEELSRKAATVRDLDTGEQVEVSLETIPTHLTPFR